ncbi:MAG: hypothetical protein ACO3A2_03430 [Bdellovibrionia bacterium]
MDLRSKGFCFLLLFFAFQSLSVLASDDRVGDIRYSILSEGQFQALHGKDWEILRGQEVPLDSQLREFWNAPNVPDSRGVFLRCANQNRAREQGNPEGDLEVGAYQADQFKEHNHGGGNHHHHTFLELTASRNSDGNVRNTVANYPLYQSPVQTTDSGEIIKPEGDQETRPRCVTVNAFIKIQESSRNLDARANSLHDLIERLMSSSEFLDFIRNSIVSNLKNFKL